MVHIFHVSDVRWFPVSSVQRPVIAAANSCGGNDQSRQKEFRGITNSSRSGINRRDCSLQPLTTSRIGPRPSAPLFGPPDRPDGCTERYDGEHNTLLQF